jgi:hypothetical protein
MTFNRATLAIVSAAYLALGSIHEEARLLAAHRRSCERYQVRVPFQLGGIQARKTGEPR